MDQEAGYVADDTAATRHKVGSQQCGIVLCNVWRDVELQLRNGLPTGVIQLLVDFAGYVEDDVLVGGVAVVTVTMPVARLVVYLHVAHPQHTVNLHLGFEKIGACILVVTTGVEHLDTAPIDGGKRAKRENLVLPAVVE